MQFELRQSLQQQAATANVLKSISHSTFDLKTVLQTLVESAARLCEADQSTITRQIGGKFFRAVADKGRAAVAAGARDISRMTGRPSSAATRSATIRAITSVVPPAAKGTTILTG